MTILRWREYTLRLPEPFADQLEAALKDQELMEERPMEISEFCCWLLTLGLQHRAALLKRDEKAQRRIILPGEPT